MAKDRKRTLRDQNRRTAEVAAILRTTASSDNEDPQGRQDSNRSNKNADTDDSILLELERTVETVTTATVTSVIQPTSHIVSIGNDTQDSRGEGDSNGRQKRRKVEDDGEVFHTKGPSKTERRLMKKEAKKAKKSEGLGGKPCIMLSRSHTKLGIKDLRDLVVYLLTDTKVLPWIMVKNKFNVTKVVVVYVPGLDPQLFNIDLENPESIKPIAWTQMATAGPATEFRHMKAFFDVMNVMRAGGDKVRIHPPVDTLLNVPLSNSERHKKAEEMKQKRLAAATLKAENYMLKVDELRELDFPLPTYLDPTAKLRSGWIETPKTTGTPPIARKLIAMDCEMVRTTAGSEVTRISLVDEEGRVLYDELVVPDNAIVDYLTPYSGMTEERLRGVKTKLADVQRKLQEVVTYDTILVGHSLENDMKVLQWLDRRIQEGGDNGHDSIEDARACLDLAKLKIKEGPGFGEYNQDQEPIFTRLARHQTKRTSAVVDDAPFLGKLAADAIVEAATDTEVVEGVSKMIQEHNFVWARLHAMEINHGRTARTPTAVAEDGGNGDDEGKATPLKIEATEEQIREAVRSIDDSIAAIVESLPAHTAVIVTSGQGDPREMRRMQARQKAFQKLYNTLSLSAIAKEDQFLDEDHKMLELAVERAKNGVCFFMVK
ncbi:hypothetical protein BGZ98_003610 [Dissophora globulifera]|nr:hypothetical protein BGZ98_003610 [Dissophora globulifera]